MKSLGNLSRRGFLQGTAATLAASPFWASADEPVEAERIENSLEGRLYKSLKIGMVRVDGSLTDKFKAAKAAGFEAIEMNAPGMNVDDTKRAIEESGLPVDGTVCSTHWSTRHTDPNAETRAKALADLKTAIRDTHAVGGKTTLLVIGRGTDGPAKEVWARSIENITQAIPLAARLGIVIAIENVWNQMLYNHDGGADQTADQFVHYVDELNSPWVGMQFDIGNHWKYGPTGDWIRNLGKRIVKLDVKGFSREKDRFTKIGEGDLDWADVRKALVETNFYGYCAAEVGGGGPDRLLEVSQNMSRVFGLA